MRQAKVLDISRYWRTGGTNWSKVRQNFDAVGICACVGMNVDELLEEHTQNAAARNIRYFTYCIPDPNQDPDLMAEFYVTLPGVADGLIVGDVEPMYKGAPLGTEYFHRKFFERMEVLHGTKPWYYSNSNNTKAIGNPNWIKDLFVWWAEYKYQVWPNLYKYFDDWLEKYPWWQPKWSNELGIDVGLHQFTPKGDAQHYAANPYTLDPVYVTGIKSADLNVSLVDVYEFWDLWKQLEDEPEPPPVDPGLETRVLAMEAWQAEAEERITALEDTTHEHEPEPEPPETVIQVTVREDKAVAMGYKQTNDSGYPIININVYDETKDPALKWLRGETINVHDEAVRADGGNYFWELWNVPNHGYPALYVDCARAG